MKRTRAPSGDPTIPRKPPKLGNSKAGGKVDGPTEGRLVDMGSGRIKLACLTTGNDWSADSVRVVQGSFGFDAEGVAKAPRPWVFAPGTETPLVKGDVFLIHYVNGDPTKPVISGGIRSLAPSDPSFFPAQAVGADPNPVRLRAVRLGAVGMANYIQVRALETGGDFEIMVGGGAFENRLGGDFRIQINYTEGKIRIGRGGEANPVPKGDMIVQALQDLATDIIAVNAALPSLTPVPTLNATQLLVDTATSLADPAGGGPPLLSPIVRVE